MLGPHLVDLFGKDQEVWPFWRMYVPGRVGSGVSKAHAIPPQLTFILSLPWTLFQHASLSYCSRFPAMTVMVQITLCSPKLNVYKLLWSQCFIVATENQLSNPGWLLQSEWLGRTCIMGTLSEDLSDKMRTAETWRKV